MKTKKILAIVTLVAFMISILPMAAFAAVSVNTYASVVTVDKDSASAVGTITNLSKGLEIELTTVSQTAATAEGGENLTVYVGTNREATDTVYYKNTAGTWTQVDTDGESEGVQAYDEYYNYPVVVHFAEGESVASTDIKIVSKTAGTIKFAIGIDEKSEGLRQYLDGQDFTTGYSIGQIIGQKMYNGTFTAASVTNVTLTSSPYYDNGVVSNGVDYYEVTAYVSAGSYPVAGKEVTFSLSGTGATMNKSTATTGTNGKASIKVTATKPGTYTINAEAGDVSSDDEDQLGGLPLYFTSTGIVNISADSDNNQKIAILSSGAKEFDYKLYDAAGNEVTLVAEEDPYDFADVVVMSTPSGSDFDEDSIELQIDEDDLNLEASILYDNMDEDGTYSFKVYLTNGKSVTYTFTAAEQGKVVSMVLKYDSDNYAIKADIKAPTITYSDAAGYKTDATPDDLNDVTFSVNDASFIDAWGDDGAFKLEDKLGAFTVTAVDSDKNMVATASITVRKAASYLVLTAPSYTTIGEDAKVKIQLVDSDGNAVSNGIDADEDSKAIILSKEPSGAIVAEPELDLGDFAEDGTATATLSSNVAGTVAIQVVIIEDSLTGRVYTGSVTVPFGGAIQTGDNLTMFIGALNYMVGNTPGISDAAPFILNGRTYVAVRPITEALKGSVTWNEATQTVVMTTGNETLTIVIGSPVIKVTRGGVVTEYPCDAPAMIKDGRTFLPFRCIGEAMGYTVNYYAETGAVMFTK